jgi:tetratricopeptide (TPR) repeat protein
VLPCMLDLADLSLVEAEGRRYRLLETIRDYAQERLVQDGDAPAVRARHACCFLERAQDRAPGQLARWLDATELDLSNVRAALDWFVGHDATAGLRLHVALLPFWDLRGVSDEEQFFGDQLLERASEGDALRATALARAARVAQRRGQLARAKGRIREAQAAAGASGDLRAGAIVRRVQASIEIWEGRLDLAESQLSEALRLSGRAADPVGAAEALEILGVAAGVRRDGRLAEEAYSRSIDLLTEEGRKDESFASMTYLAGTLMSRGELDRARVLLLETLHLGRALRHRLVAHALDLCGLLASADRRPQLALRLGGAAAALKDTSGLRGNLLWASRIDPQFRRTRAHVGQEAADAWWAEGRRMTMAEAVDTALSALEG